jgi:hypothetical protein
VACVAEGKHHFLGSMLVQQLTRVFNGHVVIPNDDKGQSMGSQCMYGVTHKGFGLIRLLRAIE